MDILTIPSLSAFLWLVYQSLHWFQEAALRKCKAEKTDARCSLEVALQTMKWFAGVERMGIVIGLI